MSKSVMELSEKQVQELIADFPWLLNLDYETIPQLKNKGMEYGLTENKRADLLLRDRKTGRLIIVEFKKVEFNRENMGQILEYRTRIINEYTDKDNTDLKEIFGTMMLNPILILVVPNCTAEARLTCNLSGVEIYEYDKSVPEIIVPQKRKSLDRLFNEMKKDIIPFDEDRCEEVDRIYKEIRELLNEEDLLEGWTSYKRPKGEYFDNIAHLFVNKWLFVDSEIGIGVYEDIFNDFNKIIIEFCSKREDDLNNFIEKCSAANLKFPEDELTEEDVEPKWDVNTWTFRLDKKAFVKDVKETLRPFIRNYKRIIYG